MTCKCKKGIVWHNHKRLIKPRETVRVFRADIYPYIVKEGKGRNL
jgi:hypothetical protein